MPVDTGKKGGRAPRKRVENVLVEERVKWLPSAQANSNSPSASAAPISITIDSGSPIIQQAGTSAIVASTVSHSAPGAYYPQSHPLPYQPYTSYPSCQPSYMPKFSPVFSPPDTAYDPPAGATTSPFSLVFVSGNISVCAGCSNHYPKPIMAPYDVSVWHTEWRSFTVDGTPKSKFSPPLLPR